MLRQNAEVERDAGNREPADASPASRTAVGPSPRTAVAGSRLPSPADQEAVRSPLSPAAAYYAESFGWPVAMIAGGIVVECGSVVSALAMHVGLGGHVSHLLGLHRLHAPVVEVHREGRSMWVFLCEPRRCDQPTPSLAHHGVRHFGEGTQVPLPFSAVTKAGSPRWVTRPDLAVQDPLPPWMAVFSCVRKAVQG